MVYFAQKQEINGKPLVATRVKTNSLSQVTYFFSESCNGTIKEEKEPEENQEEEEEQHDDDMEL